MFKKIISILGMMFFAFGINVGAQSIQTQKISAGKSMPKFSAQQVTSKIDIKGDESWRGYWNGKLDDKVSSVGAQAEPLTYDVAICYPAGSAEIASMTMQGMRFTFPGCANVRDVKIWMSTTLPVVPEDADILVQEVTELTDVKNEEDPFIEVRFDKPYKSDITKDLYIGYTFTVVSGDTDADNYPVLTYMSEDIPNALLLKFGGAEGQWSDYYGYGFGILAMQVLMSGEFPENAVMLNESLGNYTYLTDSEITIPVVAKNAGTSGIKSMDITVTMNGESSQFTIEPFYSVVGIGTEYQFDIKFKPAAGTESGCYDVTVSVDKINGEPNNIEAVSKGNIYLVSKAVTKKPLVEEFTGMWCGYCPRGIVGMQKLREIYNDDVAIVEIHVGDALDCKDYEDIYKDVPGYPSANVDRSYINVDPFYGLLYMFGIGEIVETCSSVIPVAQVDAYANIDGDVLVAKSEVEFFYSGDASNFGVAYILTEDGMEDEKWAQSNYYTEATEVLGEDPLFEFWVNNEAMVYGLSYNEVAIAAKGITTGVEGALPAKVTDGDKYFNTVEFNLNNYPYIQDRTKLNLIVALLDNATGNVVNANFVPISVDTSVAGVDADGENVKETARYTADGRRISVPRKGVNIVKYNDGTARKIIVR